MAARSKEEVLALLKGLSHFEKMFMIMSMRLGEKYQKRHDDPDYEPTGKRPKKPEVEIDEFLPFVSRGLTGMLPRFIYLGQDFFDLIPAYQALNLSIRLKIDAKESISPSDYPSIWERAKKANFSSVVRASDGKESFFIAMAGVSGAHLEVVLDGHLIQEWGALQMADCYARATLFMCVYICPTALTPLVDYMDSQDPTWREEYIYVSKRTRNTRILTSDEIKSIGLSLKPLLVGYIQSKCMQPFETFVLSEGFSGEDYHSLANAMRAILLTRVARYILSSQWVDLSDTVPYAWYKAFTGYNKLFGKNQGRHRSKPDQFHRPIYEDLYETGRGVPVNNRSVNVIVANGFLLDVDFSWVLHERDKKHAFKREAIGYPRLIWDENAQSHWATITHVITNEDFFYEPVIDGVPILYKATKNPQFDAARALLTPHFIGESQQESEPDLPILDNWAKSLGEVFPEYDALLDKLRKNIFLYIEIKEEEELFDDFLERHKKEEDGVSRKEFCDLIEKFQMVLGRGLS